MGKSYPGIDVVITFILLFLKLLGVKEITWLLVFTPIIISTLFYSICLIFIILTCKKDKNKK